MFSFFKYAIFSDLFVLLTQYVTPTCDIGEVKVKSVLLVTSLVLRNLATTVTSLEM